MNSTVQSGTTWDDQRRLAFLLEAARHFGTTLDLDKIYESLRTLIDRAFPMDGLVVSSFDPDSQLIHCEYAWSDGSTLDSSAFGDIQWKPEGVGMQSRVIKTGLAEIFNVPEKVREPNTSYLEATPEGGTAPVQEEPSTKSAMMVPMLLDDCVTGVVQAMSDRAHAYSADDLLVFEGLVSQMTAAWHHAKLFRKSEEDRRLIERILSVSPDAIYVFDLRTMTMTFANEGFAKALDYKVGEVARDLEVMHPEDRKVVAGLLARFDAIGEGQVLETQFRLRSKDGEYRWFTNRATPFERDENGKIIKLLGLAQDVTSRKQDEKALSAAEEQYRLLAESGPFIIFTATADNRIDYVNARWKEYFGVDMNPENQDDRLSRMHPDEREPTRNAYYAAMQEGRAFECEYRLLRHDGVFRWHVCRSIPQRDEAGNIVKWIGILFDIHDQKQAEEELERRVEQRTAELQQAVKELEGFTYTVSHDLRGPLRAISGASMMLREDYGDKLPEDAHQHLQRQVEAVKKMGNLIDDLLKLSRISRQELTPEDFDLSALAGDVLEELKATGDVHVQPEMRAFGDPRLVKFVLLNLIENAIKFSPEGSSISVGKEGEKYFVRDRGIGFEQQYSEKVFLPFERLVRADEYPGTGIGLANVQRIIARHGGKVWAESKPGEGATFYFTLPHPGKV